MSDVAGKVTAHYGSEGIAARILAEVAAAGHAVDRIAAETLYPFDQMHARRLAGTKDHLARLALTGSDRLLDIGSGLGGPARYAATTFGCRVTGIDLTPELVEAARELTQRCELSDRVDFHVADAAAMPFADATFDVASCHYVGMNIADKAAVLTDIARVLKPGGRLAWSQATHGSGEPYFPLPWASDPSASFLVDPAELSAAFEAAGFRVIECVDESDILRASTEETRAKGAQLQLTKAVQGSAASERSRNFSRSILEGRVGSVAVLAERR